MINSKTFKHFNQINGCIVQTKTTYGRILDLHCYSPYDLTITLASNERVGWITLAVFYILPLNI